VSYLVDTDVLSEPSHPRPSQNADVWLAAHQSQIDTSAIRIGEIKRGIARLPASARRTALEKWLEAVLISRNGRILAFNTRVAETWGEMMADLERQGAPMPLADSQIAPIARRHNLTLATRNALDFTKAGIPVVNPFI
jgi:predicted nucleic acid-binding protein